MCPFPETEPCLVAPGQDVLHSQLGAEDPESGHVEQGVSGLRKGAKPLAHFLAKLFNVASRRGPRQSAVQIEFYVVVRHVTVGKMSRSVQHHLGRRRCSPVFPCPRRLRTVSSSHRR